MNQTNLFPHLNPVVDPNLSADQYHGIQYPKKTRVGVEGRAEPAPQSSEGAPPGRVAEGKPKQKPIHTSMDMLQSHITLLERITARPGDLWTNIIQELSDKKMAYLKALNDASGI